MIEPFLNPFSLSVRCIAWKILIPIAISGCFINIEDSFPYSLDHSLACGVNSEIKSLIIFGVVAVPAGIFGRFTISLGKSVKLAAYLSLPSFQSLGDADQLEEERRLMYVALTRAEENLFIIKPNLDLSQSNYYRYSGIQFSNPSRFIQESGILKDYTEQWALQEEKPKSSFGVKNSYNYDASSFKQSQSQSKKPKRPLYPGQAKFMNSKYGGGNSDGMNQELSENDFDSDRDRRKYYF